MKTPPFLAGAWLALALSSAMAAKNPAMAPVEDDPDLPRVLLIGDSISIAYTLDVRQRLEGVANVHRIPTNGGPTSRGLEQLDKWLTTGGKTAQDWDVIHFNWGLHDLCYRNPESKTQGNRDKISGTITHSLEDYAANLQALLEPLKATGAKLIFATTTPVPEGEAGRVVGDDLRYNEAATGIMQRYGIEVNDLHAVMAGQMGAYATEPGNVHFTAVGSALLGARVAAAIQDALGYEALFDGTAASLEEHWQFEEGSWVIDKEGALTCTMKEVPGKDGKTRTVGRGYIWSRDDRDNFVLTLSYKLSEGANSGVFYRTDPGNAVQGGFEIQLMDNEGFQKTHGVKDAKKLNGSFYDGMAPSSNPARPVGQWNTLRLTCKGPHISLGINGVEVFAVDVDQWDTAGKNPDGSSNKFKTALKDLPRTGRIGLQNHGQVVWFRDIRIRDR